MSVLSTSAQEIYDEVRRIEKEAKAFANDTKNNLEARKIATFKYDAIYYLIDKASQEPLFSEYELGVQTNAMIEFVNLFVSKLSTLKKNKDKDMLKAVFRTATINNSLFNDVDKEVIYSYVDNENFITQFSLDTDWPKALAEVQSKLALHFFYRPTSGFSPKKLSEQSVTSSLSTAISSIARVYSICSPDFAVILSFSFRASACGKV